MLPGIFVDVTLLAKRNSDYWLVAINKPRRVPRVDDRRVLSGIFWVLRSGAPWRALPERYCPRTTHFNRFNRWREAGVWDRFMDAISAAHGGGIQMIDSASVRAHQQAATAEMTERAYSGLLALRDLFGFVSAFGLRPRPIFRARSRRFAA